MCYKSCLNHCHWQNSPFWAVAFLKRFCKNCPFLGIRPSSFQFFGFHNNGDSRLNTLGNVIPVNILQCYSWTVCGLVNLFFLYKSQNQRDSDAPTCICLQFKGLVSTVLITVLSRFCIAKLQLTFVMYVVCLFLIQTLILISLDASQNAKWYFYIMQVRSITEGASPGTSILHTDCA